MKTTLLKAAALSFFAPFLFASAAHAQSKGAFVKKYDYSTCMTTELTGLSSCLNMTQGSFLLLPNGKAKSVWNGTLPAGTAPATKTVFYSNWTEVDLGVLYDYSSVCVIQPDGSVRLTLNGEEAD